MSENEFDNETDVANVSDRMSPDTLLVNIDGYEGPLDLLLMMARTQKVDLRKISILQLSLQYLSFIEKASALRIELAADYLVMAAWLAYLKSRLLLPPDSINGEQDGEELAAHLAFQLERLQAMRDASAKLMARGQLGQDFFCRGIPEDVLRIRKVTYGASLLDLMQGYARIRTKDDFRPYVMNRDSVFTLEQALEHMRRLIGFAGSWTDISTYLPESFISDGKRLRSATASTFAAALELAKEGNVEIRQKEAFAAIELRLKDQPLG